MSLFPHYNSEGEEVEQPLSNRFTARFIRGLIQLSFGMVGGILIARLVILPFIGMWEPITPIPWFW